MNTLFELPAEFAHMANWSVEQIADRMRAIGSEPLLMSEHDKAEMHALKLALPSQAEEVAGARARIAERVAQRRARETQRAATGLEAMSDTEFMTARQKVDVVDDMRRLLCAILKDGLPSETPKGFTHRLYEHVHMHCGHIAHYDRNGFWLAQLGTSKRALAFFNGMASHAMVGWSVHDYRDVNEALRAAVAEKMEALRALLEAGLRSEAVRDMRKLAAEAGIELDAGVLVKVGGQTAAPVTQGQLF